LVDERIHQALLYALDRPALVSAFNAGNGSIFNSFMTHSWYQKPEWADLYPFDPDKARTLLQEAGWDSSRTVKVNIITVANDEARSMLAAEQQMLADVGFNIQFEEMELPVWVDKFYESHDFELVRVTFGVFPDPDGFLNFHLRTGSKNAFGYVNPELDAKIDKGRETVAQEDRIPIYQEINEEMLRTLPVCPLYLPNMWWVRNVSWGVPQLDALPRATSLDTIPVAPVLVGSMDVWGYHQETWTRA
jgi:peptide/nickel transport system substrate-binding protein